MVTQSKLEAEIEEKKKLLAELALEINEARSRVALYEGQIAQLLMRGNREELAAEQSSAKQRLSELEESHKAEARAHAQLFRSKLLAQDLVEQALREPLEELRHLHEEGKIPNETIPVLEEKLKSGLCICGESLEPSDPEGQRRRAYMQALIESSRQQDELTALLTDLFFASRWLSREQPADEHDRWLAALDRATRQRTLLKKQLEDLGRRIKEIDSRIQSIEDVDLEGLRDARKSAEQGLEQLKKKKINLEIELTQLEQNLESTTKMVTNLTKAHEKHDLDLARFEVGQDLQKVFKKSLERIKEIEMRKVSEQMNKIFLEMIGADPDQNSIIQRAEISETFDILVFGPGDRRLNPEHDLNGASRRALTLAFILALTKVSEVEAPNVIDTPLGMTSGFVRLSMLQKVIQESTQPVLFLTHDEITGCEDILDQHTGVIVTLTNPTHYPRMLCHPPSTSEQKVLVCRCDHRGECVVCQRRTNINLAQEA